MCNILLCSALPSAGMEAGGFHPSRPPGELPLVFPTNNTGMLRRRLKRCTTLKGKLRFQGQGGWGERWRKRRQSQVGKLEGRKGGRKEGWKEGRGGCDAGSADDKKQCWLRGEKGLFGCYR